MTNLSDTSLVDDNRYRVLAIVEFKEVVDPERILPMVLEQYLPVGILALAGFLAASILTLDSSINAGASYAVHQARSHSARSGGSRLCEFNLYSGGRSSDRIEDEDNLDRPNLELGHPWMVLVEIQR